MIFCDKTERCLQLAQEEHFCPYCKSRLSCCEAPPIHVGDGLGWGSEVLFICLNDECPLYANSWKQFEEMYGQSASCRYMLLPGSTKGECMMVGSKDAYTGSVINIEDLQRQNQRFQKEKEAAAQLESCLQEGNISPVLYLLQDEWADLATRKKAVELLDKFDDLSCIDALRNHTFRHTDLEQLVGLAINTMLNRNHRKECPYCKEIIKTQATVCKHCGKEI